MLSHKEKAQQSWSSYANAMLTHDFPTNLIDEAFKELHKISSTESQHAETSGYHQIDNESETYDNHVNEFYNSFQAISAEPDNNKAVGIFKQRHDNLISFLTTQLDNQSRASTEHSTRIALKIIDDIFNISMNTIINKRLDNIDYFEQKQEQKDHPLNCSAIKDWLRMIAREGLLSDFINQQTQTARHDISILRQVLIINILENKVDPNSLIDSSLTHWLQVDKNITQKTTRLYAARSLTASGLPSTYNKIDIETYITPSDTTSMFASELMAKLYENTTTVDSRKKPVKRSEAQQPSLFKQAPILPEMHRVRRDNDNDGGVVESKCGNY